MSTINIAIDGPSGSGKSTLAKSLAEKLGYVYVDTGAIYRTVGLYAMQNDIDPHDEAALSARFSDIDIRLVWDGGGQKVFLGGKDVSEDIRTPKASMYASAVSALPAVRAFLLDMQRKIADENNVIMDGRDIGTVVLPNACVKIFMSAHPEIRAKRRYNELCAKGKQVTYDDVYRDMIERDKNDSTRASCPCVPAKDAVLFDNSALSLEETLSEALKIIEGKMQ